jgi:hypothetical protein
VKQSSVRTKHEQRHELRGVLAIANLREAHLPLDDPERMLDLGADARLEVLVRICAIHHIEGSTSCRS